MSQVYEAKIYLKSGGPAVTVTVNAKSSSEARRIIEAQYEMKSYSSFPHELR